MFTKLCRIFTGYGVMCELYVHDIVVLGLAQGGRGGEVG